MVRNYPQPAEGISVSATRNAQRVIRSSKRSRRMGRALLLAAGLAVAGTLAVAPAAQAYMTITPTFDSSITGSSYSGIIEGDINTALQFYNNTFTNPVTVQIYFATTTGASYLGESYSAYYTSTYAAYKGELTTNANMFHNAIAQTAVNNLVYGNDSSGTDNILATSADRRALGESTPGALNSSGVPGAGGGYIYDGVINLNATDLSGFGGGGSYSANRVIQHEVDEVLGVGGAGSTLNSTYSRNNPSNYYGPMDLFRYSSTHTPSYTTSGSATSYFSIDGGATNVASFNQDYTGDYGDWGGTTNYVQQAFTSVADGPANVSVTSPEGIALQAVGYDTQLIWDASGANAADPTDGLGTWSTSAANWSNGATDSAWVNSSTTVAVIGNSNGAAGTITLGSDITANGITFDAAGSGVYTVAPGSYTLTLAGATPTLTMNADATISAPIAGVDGLTVAGANTLTLSSLSNTYTGGTTINSGATLNVTGVIGGAVIDNGTFELNDGFSITDLTGSGTLAMGGNFLGVTPTANDTFSGTVTGAASAVLDVSGGSPLYLYLNGDLSGFSGTLESSNGGMLIIDSVLNASATLKISSGGETEVTYDSLAGNAVTFSGNSTAGLLALSTPGTSGTLGAIGISDTSGNTLNTIDAYGGTLTLGGAITSGGTGDNTLTLQNGKISLGSYNNSADFTGGTLVIGDGTDVTKVYFGASATHGSGDYLPAAAVPIELNNGTLEYTASGSYAGYLNNPITVDSTGGVINAGGGGYSLTLDGAITDSSGGTLILHDGTIVLHTGNSGFTTGTLQIGNGLGTSVVQFSSAGYLPGSSAGITLDQGELQYTGSGSVTVGNNIATSSGTHNIIDVNNQTVTLTGDLSGSGNLEAKDITFGTLELNPAGNNLGFTGTLDINNSGGAVTLALDSQNAVTGGGITFDGGELLNNSGGALTFAVANALTVNVGGGTIDTNGQDNVFNGTITGTGALTFNGGGIAELHGDSSLTYSGPVTIDAPTTVIFYNAGSFGTGSVTLGPVGGELEAGASGVPLPNDVALSDTFTITNGAPAAGQTPDIYNTGGYTDALSGVISGDALDIISSGTGGGEVDLNGVNTYAGGTLIEDNVIAGFNNNSSFGTSTSTITIGSGGGEIKVDTSAAIILANPITVVGNGITGTGIIDANLSGGNTDTLTLSGPISDATAGTTLIIRNGTVDLTNLNNSTDFNSGTLQIGDGAVYGPAANDVVEFSSGNNLPGSGAFLVLNEGELRYIGASPTTIYSNIELNPGANYLDANGSAVTYSGLISGSGNLDAVNSNTGTPGMIILTYPGEEYTGSTTVGSTPAGYLVTLMIAGNGQMPDPSDLTVLNNGVFDVNNTTGVTVNSLSDGGSPGGQVHLTDGGLTIDNNGLTDTATTFAGVVTGGSISLSDGAGLMVEGTVSAPYTLNLDGQNSYTGGTIVGAYGTLVLGRETVGGVPYTGSLASGGNLTVRPGGTFEVDNGIGQTIGTLSGSGDGDIALTSGGLTVDNGGSFSGVIGGNGGLTLNAPNGPDTLTLSGANNYTGLTTIGSGATLDLTGSLASEVVVDGGGTFIDSGALTGPNALGLGVNAAFTANTNVTVTDFTGDSGSSFTFGAGSLALSVTPTPTAGDIYAGTIVGGSTDDVAVIGPSGSLELVAANALSGYTGSFTVEDGGTLKIALATGLSGNALNFSNGGTFDLYDGSTVTLGAVALGPSGTAVINGGGATNAVILGGPITGSGTAVLQLENATFQLSPSTNNARFTDQTLQIGDGSDFTVTQFATGNGLDLPASTVGITLDAGELQYTGTGVSGVTVQNGLDVWSGTTNVIDANAGDGNTGSLVLAGDLASVHGTGGTLELTDGTIEAGSLNNIGFTGTLDLSSGKNGATPVTLLLDTQAAVTGGGITFDGGTLKIASTLTFAAANTIAVNSAGGTVDTNGLTLYLNGAISGSGSLTLTSSFAGSGAVDITNANTGYSGATTIENGVTVGLGASDALGIGGGSNTITIGANSADSGTLQYDAGNIALANNITLTGSGTIDLNGNTEAYAGIISGGGGLTVTGGSTLTLSQVETYTGATTVNAITTLALSGGGSIAGSSAVTVNGILDISAIAATGTSITSLVGSGAVALGVKNLILSDANGVFSGAIGGAGGLVLTTGSEILSGTNSYTGGTTINGGTLDVTGSLAGGGDVNVNGGEFEVGASFAIANLNGSSTSTLDLASGTLTVNPTTADIFAGAVTGGGDLTVNGTGGSLTLSGDLHAFTGAFDATNGGSLIIGGSSVLSSSATFNITHNLSIGVTYANLNGNAVTFSTNTTAPGGFLNVTGTSGSSGTVGTVDITDTTGNTFNTIDAGGPGDTLTLGAITSGGTGDNTLTLQNGTFVLTGANSSSFTAGTLQIGNGTNLAATVQFAANTDLPATSVGITLDSGTLKYGAGGLTVTNGLTVVGSGAIDVNGFGDPSSEETYFGSIAGSGNLTIMSSATGGGGEVDLTSSLNGAFAGNTTVQDGVEVEFAHHTAFGSTGTIYVGTGGGTLEFDFAMSPVTNNLVLNHTGTISPGGYSGAGYANTWSGTISGTGGLIVSDASGPGGVLTLAPTSGANTYSGGTTIGNGTNLVTLAVNTDADLGNANGGLTFNNGTLSLTSATFSTSRPVALAGDGTISTSGVAEFFGSISGPGALTLDPTLGSSPGTILLNAANSYSGGTSVVAPVYVGGPADTTAVVGNPDSLGSGPVALTGSTLETTNWVTGGTTGMPIDVGGTYTQDSASTLKLTISGRPSVPQEPSPGNYDYINMTNDSAVTLGTSPTFGTNLQLQFNGGFRPVADFDKYIVIADTTGTVTGTFTSITAPNNDPTGKLYRFTDANIPGTGNVVTVQTLFSPFVNGTLFTGTPNENSVANYLDTYATAANTPLDLQNLLAQLSELAPTPTNPGNEIGPALDQLTPEAEQALGNLAISNSTFMSQTVFGQIEDQFAGMTAFNAAGLAVLDTPNADPFTAAMNGAMQSVAQQNSIDSLDVNNGEPSEGGPVPIPGRESNRNTLSGFVSGNVILADLPGTGNGSQNFTTGGVISGLDYNMCSHLAIGALFAYENTSATLDNHGSKLNNQSYTPGVYLGFHKSHFYVDALGSYTYNAYSMHRNITFTNPQSTASSSPHSNQYDASAMLGYNFHVRRGLKLGPAVGVGYTHINVAGYQESGSPADLMVQSMSVDSLRMLVGGRLNYGWSPRPTMTPINFSVNAFWQHEFLDGSRGITSTFTELGAGSFVINTSPAGRDSALFGGGVSGNLAKNITLFVNYESQIGSQGALGQTVMAGVAVALK